VDWPLPAERDLEEKSKTDEINLRIQRVTEDLRAIQQELNWAAIQVPTNPEQREALSELVEAESLQALKSALDQMRHFLWFFIQVVSNESEFGERLREVLRQRVASDATPTKTTFLEKLKMATDHALVRYLLEHKNQKPN
jgi:pimeloyl-CoA synthetase